MMAIAAYLLLGLGVLAARLLVKDKQQVTESVARYADDGANSQVELKKAA
jgi:hypothetical protein